MVLKKYTAEGDIRAHKQAVFPTKTLEVHANDIDRVLLGYVCGYVFAALRSQEEHSRVCVLEATQQLRQTSKSYPCSVKVSGRAFACVLEATQQLRQTSNSYQKGASVGSRRRGTRKFRCHVNLHVALIVIVQAND